MKSAVWFTWAGRLLCLFGLVYLGREFWNWRSGFEPSLLALTAGGVMAGAGCSLMDAGRLKRAYQGIAGEMIAGWTLLSLAFTSAIVIIAATQTHEPRLAIALVFSAAFLVAGGTLYWFGRKDERSKGRKIRSVAQTEDDRDRSLVGHLDWRDGTVKEEEAQRPRRLWPAALAVAAGAPMLGLAATGAYGFGVFGAVFTGIGLFLAYRRWAGRRRMLKFGISVFILQDRPIRLKNGVVGRLLIPNAIGIRDVTAQLTCVKRRTAYRASRSGEPSKSYVTFDHLHDETISFPVESGKTGMADISFDPPKTHLESHYHGMPAVFGN
jgi:hypothetical protein